ncbi:MAG: sulfatase-like hydrolase/transferase, partial [Verrucomicrobiota bacterium]
HPETGMEYNNTNIGDGGFILKFGDGTVSSAKWKAKQFFHGPVDGDKVQPRTVHTSIPENWYAEDFDDSDWPQAVEHSEEAVGPKQPFFDHDFDGARWIWTKDLALDNTVIFRTTIPTPPNGGTSDDWPRGDFGDPNTVQTQARSVQRLVSAREPAVRSSGRHTFGDGSPVPETARAFEPLRDQVQVSWDDTYVYVRSDSIPNHRMMVGIKAWNQQVPIPHDLEFKLPIQPKLLETPAPTTLIGPLAITVNGIPIFDPTTQGGKHDAYEHGELDEFGGHAGRADDYHYHIAPFHLVKEVGEGNPIAYGLDGLPIYASTEKDGSPHGKLDEAHGHFHADGSYHYHGTKEKPYYMSGFRGEVDLDARPRTQGVREYTRPLRGASITGFTGSLAEGYTLTYDLDGQKNQIAYQAQADGVVDFTFIDPDGSRRKERYQRRVRVRGGGGGRPGGKGPPAPRKGSPPEGERKPWISQHKDELDTDRDGKVSALEMLREAKQTFTNVDTNQDGKISEVESRESRSRSAMGGFVRQHFQEIDRNSSGWIEGEELVALAKRMFDKSDRDGNGRVEGAEFERGSGGGERRGERNRGGKGEGPPPPRKGAELPATKPATPLIARSANLDRSAAPPPNIIVILIDDMGWRDMGFTGNTFVETPHADRLAREGVVFSQAYSSAPNCAPTRACLISGQFPPRHGVYTVVDERHAPGLPHHKLLAAESRAEMATDVVSIAEALKPAGYATGCFGMWNLGRGHHTPTSPEGQGFDVFKRPQDLGFERNTYFHRDGGYLPDRLTLEAVRFMAAHRDQPFLVYFAPHSVHAPFDPKPELLKKYQGKPGADKNDPVYAATIEALDINVGRLREALLRLGLAQNTTIFFTSDNGGNPQYTAPLKGGKGQLYEGGIRVPAFAWGYGVSARGTTCPDPISSIDFYPTLLELAGLQGINGHRLDGISLVPALNGRRLNRQNLYWHFPCYIGRSSPSSAVRSGTYKLIEFFEGSRLELYDLARDPGEQHNLAASDPTRTAALHRQLQAWQQATDAAMPPGANPDYDPAAVPIKGTKGGKNKGRKGGNKRI